MMSRGVFLFALFGWSVKDLDPHLDFRESDFGAISIVKSALQIEVG